ncbi:PspA/IM30 family protein [Alteromonas sp. a30]|uniref:PspA/IM30 family protein n=1 Tax=Alteromonas sp. a30 TaxID=2730917 RepID=UPI002282CB6E|nr:PspA/IM30 family protein [Alteromonas sp. a30]MCY7296543.1 phage shock protein PspA [Alteromonas sp. a30]
MSVFSRLGDVLQANINAMLDKAEDPQKMLSLIVAEMEQALGDVRQVAAGYLAEQKGLDRQIARLEKKVSHWESSAELALSKGREDLAKSAIEQKIAAQEELDNVQVTLDELKNQISALQDDAQSLADKLAEARSKQKSIMARAQNVEVRMQAKSVSRQERVEYVKSRFDQYERRIDNLEAQLEAHDFVGRKQTLSQEIAALEKDEKVNKELEALRQRVA